MATLKNFYTIQVSGFASKDSEWLSAELFDLGAQGVNEPFVPVGQETPALLTAYFPEPLSEIQIATLKEMFPGVQFQPGLQEDQDWNAEWKKTYKSFELFPNFWIVPSWEKSSIKPEDRLLIDPGMAFGTGTHETTQMACELLSQIIKPGDTVLDVGTGTGILAMFAEKRGAAKILGTDNDPDAVRVAKENRDLNGLNKLELSTQDLPEIKTSYDTVIANIISGVLLEMRPELTRLTKTNLVMTGVLQSEFDEFVQPWLKDFTLLRSLQKGEWAAFLFGKK